MSGPSLADLRERFAQPRAVGIIWSGEDDDLLVGYRAQGMSFGTIAGKMRRSSASCERRFKVIGASSAVSDINERQSSRALLAASLDHFDSIVDRTGCSFRDAMTRCGLDGVPVI